MYDIAWDEPTRAHATQTAKRLNELRADPEPLALEHKGRRHFAPTSADQLDALLAAHPQATLLAGGTDVGLWVTKLHRDLGDVIYLGSVAELNGIVDRDGELVIGAAVTHAQAFDVIAREFPDFGELLRRFGSTPVRNSSTVGGNVANGSPIGDSMPALIALGARVALRGPDGEREIPLEDLYIAYGKQSREPGEYVVRLRIAKLKSGEQFRCYKLSKRFDQDISAVCAAFKLRLENGRVAEIRIGFGGVAAVPARTRKTETALTHQPWNEATLAHAEAVLGEEFAPLTDMRASHDYRRLASTRLLRKFFIETTKPEAATRVLDAEATA
ncbi:MAG TPA: FAD binding domain-containing protein, partial [Rudaea sp.]|nr:FAD binding domain-containing protein [Rudaea sp.]